MSETYLLVVLGVRRCEEFSFSLLRYFMRHYLDCGMAPSRIHVSLMTDGSIPEVKTYLEDLGARIIREVTSPHYDPFEVTYERRALQTSIPEDAWLVNPDMDELIAFPKPISEVVADLESHQCDCLGGNLWDRFDSQFLLKKVHHAHPIHLQLPVPIQFTSHVLGGNPHKEVLARNWFRVGQGGHLLEPRPGRRCHPAPAAWELRIDHYKWTYGLKTRTERLNALALAEPHRYPWRHEYERLLNAIQTSGAGDFIVHHEPLTSTFSLPRQ